MRKPSQWSLPCKAETPSVGDELELQQQLLRREEGQMQREVGKKEDVGGRGEGARQQYVEAALQPAPLPPLISSAQNDGGEKTGC